MSPWSIKMYVNDWGPDKEPLYCLVICDVNGACIKRIDNKPKEYCIKALAEYCGVTLNLAVI